MKTPTTIVLALSISFVLSGCGGSNDSPASGGAAPSDAARAAGANSTTAATSDPLKGQWVVDLDATASYHGMLGTFTDQERTRFENASFEFTGHSLKYDMGAKSGEVEYTVKSATDTAVILEMEGGVTPTLTFQFRPGGGLILPQDGRWDMVVLKRK